MFYNWDFKHHFSLFDLKKWVSRMFTQMFVYHTGMSNDNLNFFERITHSCSKYNCNLSTTWYFIKSLRLESWSRKESYRITRFWRELEVVMQLISFRSWYTRPNCVIVFSSVKPDSFKFVINQCHCTIVFYRIKTMLERKPVQKNSPIFCCLCTVFQWIHVRYVRHVYPVISVAKHR